MTIDPLKRMESFAWAPADAGGGTAGGSTSSLASGSADGPAGGAADSSGEAGSPPANTGGTLLNKDPSDGADKDAGAQASEQQPDGQAADENKDGQQAEGETNTDASPTEFKIDMPEGLEGDFTAEVEAYSEAAQSFLSENPDATAADALKWAAQFQANAVQGEVQKAVDQLQAQVNTWEEQARENKEIGGDKFDENVAVAVRAVDALEDQDLKELLARTGLGSHPGMLRLAYRAGRAMGEAPVLSSTPGSAKKSITAALYGNS